jgi:hypothetical protein
MVLFLFEYLVRSVKITLIQKIFSPASTLISSHKKVGVLLYLATVQNLIRKKGLVGTVPQHFADSYLICPQ